MADMQTRVALLRHGYHRCAVVIAVAALVLMVATVMAAQAPGAKPAGALPWVEPMMMNSCRYVSSVRPGSR